MPREHDGSITVRYWAAARAAAGVDEDVVTGCATVGDAVTAVARQRPALAPVASVSTLLLDGRAAQRDDPVPEGSIVEVLPPFAGG